MKKIADRASEIFPLKQAPLVHCITNDVSIETVANTLLYINAQPIMTNDVREFSELFKHTSSLLLNLGSLSKEKESALLMAAKKAKAKKKPFVLDIVGVTSAPIAFYLSQQLEKYKPNILKGNVSELRAFCGLKVSGRGVDSSEFDQTEEGMEELVKALKQQDSSITYLATGKKDLIVSKDETWVMENGVEKLQQFTGSGDLLGALIAALLGEGFDNLSAAIFALSYLNICGEHANKKLTSSNGLADFRHETLNQLSLLSVTNDNWFNQVKGRKQ
ncbi:PfkB family carbohydrate kinase [Tetragenococcus muriaticus]|uniref:Hydroxyethylthiazole kinase n=2 Tax=Tetragenococcus muriaticus TaxID=64642 RepID=A0A091C5S6_9ENTE|nr:PfkB family carbohydrate kinase [Tetragenococcus muriaticus]KFN93211.1 hydroxyethylthiazole kinase [Tetragenococcus muriaticus 3MR10-3]KFN93778.1 hydroxyethylthiazole kinase [Tetragenococcus muriaticus PMC-11-5]